MTPPLAPYPQRIRAGDVEPWVGRGADGARRSAAIVEEELAVLWADDPRRPGLEEQRRAWLDRAAILEEHAP